MESLEANIFWESWQNCALANSEIKVEKLTDENVEVTRENFHKNTTSNEANVTYSIEKTKLQSELERLPIVVTAQKHINDDKLNDYSSEDDEYLIEESQNVVNFSLKRHIETKPSVTESEEEESPSTLKNSKCNEKVIKEEYFVDSKLIVQEELDIKDEDEGDQLTAKSALNQIKKQHHPKTGTAPLDRISTNKRRFQLTGLPVFKCFSCAYQTDRKLNIARHVFIHMEKILECSQCSYKTRNKEIFRQHELIHVPREQVKSHHCTQCSYASTRKHNLTRHMKQHKKADDVIWYQSPECPYRTKYQGSLTYRHMLNHEHKCTLCGYESSQKDDLTRHIQLVHKLKDVIQIMRCQEEGCFFKTHHKSNLARHFRRMHEYKKLFKCSKCSYQTQYASNIKAHELGHEDRNKWFSCTLCPHKTTTTTDLKQHMMVHKSDSKIQWSEYPFKTKHNESLKLYNFNSEKTLKCPKCSYKTVYAKNFRAHRLVH